jgi:hypothetical protein
LSFSVSINILEELIGFWGFCFHQRRLTKVETVCLGEHFVLGVFKPASIVQPYSVFKLVKPIPIHGVVRNQRMVGELRLSRLGFAADNIHLQQQRPCPTGFERQFSVRVQADFRSGS